MFTLKEYDTKTDVFSTNETENNLFKITKDSQKWENYHIKVYQVTVIMWQASREILNES